jgi:hypothetical protein
MATMTAAPAIAQPVASGPTRAELRGRSVAITLSTVAQ